MRVSHKIPGCDCPAFPLPSWRQAVPTRPSPGTCPTTVLRTQGLRRSLGPEREALAPPSSAEGLRPLPPVFHLNPVWEGEPQGLGCQAFAQRGRGLGGNGSRVERSKLLSQGLTRLLAICVFHGPHPRPHALLGPPECPSRHPSAAMGALLGSGSGDPTSLLPQVSVPMDLGPWCGGRLGRREV